MLKVDIKRVLTTLIVVIIAGCSDDDDSLLLPEQNEETADPVEEIDIECYMTHDDIYVLYFGEENGAKIQYVGRDVNGEGYSPAENWQFAMPKDNWIYVLGANEAGLNGLLASFNVSGNSVITSPSEWESTALEGFAFDGSDPPPTPEKFGEFIKAIIAEEKWDSSYGEIFNDGAFAWDIIANIPYEAMWICSKVDNNVMDYFKRNSQLFRFKPSP